MHTQVTRVRNGAETIKDDDDGFREVLEDTRGSSEFDATSKLSSSGRMETAESSSELVPFAWIIKLVSSTISLTCAETGVVGGTRISVTDKDIDHNINAVPGTSTGPGSRSSGVQSRITVNSGT